MKKEFQDLSFKLENNNLKITFLKTFYFIIEDPKKHLKEFKITKNSITIEDSKEKRFNDLLDLGLNNLTSNITKKPTIYIHKHSNIPLIGNGSFGIVDRGTNLIEIKPFCGCNFDCIYCSVDENKRNVDFVIDDQYLVEELEKVTRIKQNEVEIHIGCQGEPLLYSKLTNLIKKCNQIPNVKRISMDTNGILLTKDYINDLIKAGLTQINISLNSTKKDKLDMISNKNYNLKHLLNMLDYIKTTDLNLLIAPVYMPKINDEDLKDLINLAKKLDIRIGIQNFLSYSYGKKIKHSISMEKFYKMLKGLEKTHNTKLIFTAEDFNIKKDNPLEKSFKKNQIITARVVCIGRLKDEYIAVSNNRIISVYNPNLKLNKDVKIKIQRTKHNIYSGILI